MGDRVLSILHRKYKYEYLPFFTEANKLYRSGKFGDKITESIESVKRIIRIIEIAISTGEIRKSDWKEIRELSSVVEDRKKEFFHQINESSLFREDIKEMEEQIGVSRKDLNLTKKSVSKALSRAIKSRDSRPTRGYPKTREFVGGIKEGLKVAAFGPFTPLANIAGELAGGTIRSITGGSRVLGSRMPVTHGSPEFGSMAHSGFGSTSPIVGSDKIGYRINDELFKFFNVRAYKARWTKELIDRLRVMSGVRKLGAMGALSLPDVDTVSKLFSNGLIGGFKAAGAAGAFVFAGVQIYRAFDTWKKKEKARENLISATRGLGKTISDMEGRVSRMGLKSAAKAAGMSESDLIKEMAIDKRTHQESVRQIAATGEPITSKGPFKYIPGMAGMDWLVRKIVGYKRPEVQPFHEIQADYWKKFGEIKEKRGKLDTGDLDQIVKNAASIMSGTDKLAKDLSNGVDEFSRVVDRLNEGSSRQPQVKLPPSGNQYDAADPLINSLSTGRLTIGE